MIVKKLFKKPVKEPYNPNPETTDYLPVVPFRVTHAGLPFYTDPECRTEVQEARIYILEPLDPDDTVFEPEIVPSRKIYPQGALVTWSLEKKLWETCWFKDPETGEIRQAWTAHAEFAGRLIREETIRKHQAHLAELEQKRAQRKAQAAPGQKRESQPVH